MVCHFYLVRPLPPQLGSGPFENASTNAFVPCSVILLGVVWCLGVANRGQIDMVVNFGNMWRVSQTKSGAAKHVVQTDHEF